MKSQNDDNNQICKVCGSNENLIPIEEIEKMDLYSNLNLKYKQIYICNLCISKDSSDYYFCDACADNCAYLKTELELAGYGFGVLCPRHKNEFDLNHNLS